MLFLKMMAEGNVRVVADTLEIDRVCRVNLNFSAEDCLLMDDGNHSVVQVPIETYHKMPRRQIYKHIYMTMMTSLKQLF